MSTLHFSAEYFSGQSPISKKVEIHLSRQHLTWVSIEGEKKVLAIKNLTLENIIDDEVHVIINQDSGEHLIIKGRKACESLRYLFKSSYFSLSENSTKKILIILI